jgi:hypothetical protein
MDTSSITTALPGDTRSVSYTKDTTRRERTMNYSGVERRKYQRFKAAVPVNIGLIDSKRGKTCQARFKGITTDVSMEGLGLELRYPASDILFFGAKVIGKNKEFDLEFTAKLGTKDVRGVGEVRWATMPYPSLLKIGVFLREMTCDEKQKWCDFVTNHKKVLQNTSRPKTLSKHGLIKSFNRFLRNLVVSGFSTNYVLPAMFISISVIIYWFVQIKFYHLPIPLGIGIIVVLLTKPRFFSRKYPKCTI